MAKWQNIWSIEKVAHHIYLISLMWLDDHSIRHVDDHLITLKSRDDGENLLTKPLQNPVNTLTSLLSNFNSWYLEIQIQVPTTHASHFSGVPRI